MPQRDDHDGRDDEEIVVPPFVDASPPPAAAPDLDLAGGRRAPRSLDGETQRIAARMRRINARVNERSGRNLFSAIAVALLLGGLALVSLLVDKRWFVLFGTALVVLLVVELATAMRVSGRHVPRVPSALVATAVVPIAFYFGPAAQWAALLVGLVVVVAWRVLDAARLRTRLSRESFAVDASSAAFVQFYATFLGSFTAMLAAQPRGELWVLSFLLVVICVDTGAYATGMRFGRTKLAPRISPGKTWEGIIGGGLAAIAMAVIACEFILGLPWWFGIVMGLALTVTAVAGDLSESMVKRDLGVKDMSNWLPGHGGFFDRLDSMLPSGAMAFALYFWSTPLMRLADRLG